MFFVCVPVAASIFTEVQLKGKDYSVDETSFLEKQFYLYFYGSIVALVGHLGNDAGYLPHHFVQDILGNGYGYPDGLLFWLSWNRHVYN